MADLLAHHPGFQVLGKTPTCSIAAISSADRKLYGVQFHPESVLTPQGKLARYKQPRVVEFVDQIPRNPTGKVLKRVLRERFPGPAPE